MLILNEDIWNYYKKDNNIICITTNGFVKSNGRCVMGRGIALQAKQRISGLPKIVGDAIKQVGNIPILFEKLGICTFPVKHNWWEQADLNLIKVSADHLKELSEKNQYLKFFMTKPGCHNGRRTWEEVEPIIEPILGGIVTIVDLA